MAKWIGCWTSNLVIPGSSPPPCFLLDLFSVEIRSKPRDQEGEGTLQCR